MQNRKSQVPLGRHLDELFAAYHREAYLIHDPLEFVHRFQDPWDQEAVALLGALLAYGNIKLIRRSILDALSRIESQSSSPAQWIRNFSDPQFVIRASAVFSTFVHRFNTGADLVVLFQLLNRSWLKFGSLGSHFVSYLNPKDASFGLALDFLIRDWKEAALKLGVRPSFFYLLTAPEDGSCCKRWCMFLRWMGRDDRREKEKLDPGLWTNSGDLFETFPKGRFLSPAQLVIPLDTHTGRISRRLRLTRRKSLNWKAALEVTESLRAFHPDDPVRYDFALCHAGMLGDLR